MDNAAPAAGSIGMEHGGGTYFENRSRMMAMNLRRERRSLPDAESRCTSRPSVYVVSLRSLMPNLFAKACLKEMTGGREREMIVWSSTCTEMTMKSSPMSLNGSL